MNRLPFVVDTQEKVQDPSSERREQDLKRQNHDFLHYTVKNAGLFHVPSRYVTNQILPGRLIHPRWDLENR
jgi:hypothetical protein